MAEKKLSKEEVLNGFNKLRQEQRTIASKISELEADRSEHELVADALKQVSGDRKCYRMIGGVLVERTVNQVLPALLENQKLISTTIEGLNNNLRTQGKALNEYREKHLIHLVGEGSNAGYTSSAESDVKRGQAAGVLVSETSK